MRKVSNIFNVKKYKKNDNIKIHILNIKSMTPELLNLIKEYFVNICEGDSGSDIETVKIRLLEFLDKKDVTTKMGAIAEFFVHLYLNSNEYKQECLYLNLEENSIKKGFDGYYSKDKEEWIMESKSGTISTKNISHPSKIKEAYDDLKGKVEGNVNNNPWHNAYNHAQLIDVSASRDIRNNLKKISDEFTNSKYHDISEFNIIPTSTIFLEDRWLDSDEEDICRLLVKKINKFNFKKILIVCLTKQSLELIYEFLEN